MVHNSSNKQTFLENGIKIIINTMPLLKSHLTSLAIVVAIIIMSIVIANQPDMFLADVMQGKWLDTTQKADLSKILRGNTIKILSQKEFTNVKQIDLIIQYSPETIIATPLSDYEFFSNKESDTRMKIILRPQTDVIPMDKTLIQIPYQWETQINISNIALTLSDWSSIPLSIES